MSMEKIFVELDNLSTFSEQVAIKYQTKEQVAAAIAAAEHLTRKKVSGVDAIDLTAADADKYIYMVPKATAKGGDKYDEYMILDGALEKVGDWAVDLSGYVQKEEGKGLSSNDYTAADKAKLESIAEGAVKVESSEINGNVKINGEETKVYTLPEDVLRESDIITATEADILALFAAK